MSGYFTSYGYMGFVDDRWMLFATETEYYEYMRERFGEDHVVHTASD